LFKALVTAEAIALFYKKETLIRENLDMVRKRKHKD
jgi:hypothetical protein